MRGKPHLDRENMIIENLKHFKNRFYLEKFLCVTANLIDDHKVPCSMREPAQRIAEKTFTPNIIWKCYLEFSKIGKLPTLKDERDE